MNAISIGPLAFAGDRFSVIASLVVFLAVGSLVSTRVDRRLGGWTTTAALSGVFGARAVHVLTHFESFAWEPWRIPAIWQGGFSWLGGLLGVAFATAVLWRKAPRAAPWAAISLGAGLFTWVVATSLVSGTAAPRAPDAPYAALNRRETISIAKRTGRPAVLNLWASWCPPCRREMPILADMARSNPHVDFLFANQGEGKEVVAAYLRQTGIDLDIILLDHFAELSRHYGAFGLPATLFINPDGALVTSHLGEISREVLTEKMATLSPQDRTRTE
ncbi:TlpA family protein disulfide reductase [Sinorhizobium meliloti]|uniref:TlpA disulfide reductase family protein n=1 Tax=Rhizobium meliloti TaxID=382 RepID=UPI000FD86A15|nr:TlpA disulfide reductase family protein [Sinorhizobium meliloti]MDE3795788.1 TlpA family protein disulfide reductase [Sinorhizobium meliloti]RVK58279.1 TlpA family protein disulfide reductase [Sinorhizobium meliloti]